MSVNTNNVYGKISITNEAIAKFVSRTAMDCYGIVEFSSLNIIDIVGAIFLRGAVTKGVRVYSNGDRIFVDASVVVKYGVSIKAVVEALKESLKYKVERFTGMIVDTINVRVTGVKG